MRRKSSRVRWTYWDVNIFLGTKVYVFHVEKTGMSIILERWEIWQIYKLLLISRGTKRSIFVCWQWYAYLWKALEISFPTSIILLYFTKFKEPPEYYNSAMLKSRNIPEYTEIRPLARRGTRVSTEFEYRSSLWVVQCRSDCILYYLYSNRVVIHYEHLGRKR